MRAVLLSVVLAAALAAPASAHEVSSGAAGPGYRSLQFEAPAPGTYDLPALGMAGDGTLLDERGKALELHTLLGDKIAVLSFIYSSCRDTNGCPLASFVLGSVQSRLGESPDLRDRVRLITISFDPERDRPEVMRGFAERVRRGDTDWHFLTARSEAELAPLLGAYGQTVRKDYDAAGRYLGTMSHVLRVYLIDRDKRIRNVYSTSFLHADLVMADIETLLRQDHARRDGAGAEHRDHDIAAAALDRGGPPPPPLGLPPLPPGPERASAAKVALGRKLFFDRRLSRNDTLSCAMCHVPAQGFTNNELATAVGIEGRGVKRNTPTLLNVAYASVLFHDGRATTLEEQVWGPLLADNEMGNGSADAVIAKIGALEDYESLFPLAFDGRGAGRDTIGEALASYERTLLAAASPFDRWYFGSDTPAISKVAKDGFELFTGKAGCSSCHLVAREKALFSDYDFHDTGIGWRAAQSASSHVARIEIAGATVELRDVETNEPAALRNVDTDEASVQQRDGATGAQGASGDEGRYEVTHEPRDRWKYKTPTLRNVALTAPYMHDGSLPTLASVVEFYDGGGAPDEQLDPRIHPLGLSKAERHALVAFLESLTGDTASVVADALSQAVGNPIATSSASVGAAH